MISLTSLFNLPCYIHISSPLWLELNSDHIIALQDNNGVEYDKNAVKSITSTIL